MSPTFQKIKSYYFIKAVANAIAIGLALTFFAVGGTLLTLKLLAINIEFWWYIIIGAVAFIPSALITFFVCKKSDSVIAKALDSTYSLDERVQTMVENKDESGVFAVLQREDTEDHLALVERSVYKLTKGSIVTIVSFLLAFVLFVVSICIPAVKDDDNPDEVFSIKEWQTIALESLISYVDGSKMSEMPREEIATDLLTLKESLYRIEEDEIITLVSEEVLDIEVRASITTADEAIENYNSYKILYNAIRTSEDANVKNFARGMATLDMTDRFEILRSAFTKSETEYEQLKMSLVSYADTIRVSFTTTEVPATDTLRVAIENYINDIKESANKTGGTYAQLQQDLDEIFIEHNRLINEALMEQKENRTIANYAINELISIFNIKNPPLFGGSELAGIPGEEEEEEVNTPGGPPDPDNNKYGSDDLIYDPDIEGQREYGEILTDQTSKKDSTVREEETPPELEDIIDDYFSALAGTMPMPSEPNNENE